MTTLTTGPHSTSTIAWLITTCTSTNSSTERAHVVSHLALHISSHSHFGSSLSLARTSLHHHGHPCGWSLFTLILSTLCFPAFLLPVFFSLFFWTDRGSKSSPTVRRRSRDTNSRLIMNLSKKNFIALKQKNFIDEISNFFINSY